MAAFEVYASLGVAYIVVAIWWQIQITVRYSQCQHHQREFYSSVTFPCCGSCSKVPVEAILKIIVAIILVFIQVYFSLVYVHVHSEYSTLYWTSLKFITVVLAIFMSGLVDVVQRCFPRSILTNLDFLVISCPFIIQGILFFDFLPRHQNVDSLVHILLSYTSFSTAVFFILEAKWSNLIQLSTARVFTIAIQGSWLCHSGILIDNASELVTHDGHGTAMVVTMYFAWHIVVMFIGLVIIWIVTHKLVSVHFCLCNAVDSHDSSSGVYLENRVNFDYRILDQFDPDTAQ